MTTIGMNYDVILGKEKAFEEGFGAVAEHLKSVAGHVDSRLYCEVGSVGSYLILSQWASRSQFDAFIRSAGFKKVMDWGKAEILRAPPRHKVYQND